MKMEKLNSLHIDVEKGIYEVNGRDISQSGKYLRLVFKDGTWTLVISEDTGYSTSAHTDNKRNNNSDWEMLNNASEKISKFAVAAFVISLITFVVNIMRIVLG